MGLFSVKGDVTTSGPSGPVRIFGGMRILSAPVCPQVGHRMSEKSSFSALVAGVITSSWFLRIFRISFGSMVLKAKAKESSTWAQERTDVTNDEDEWSRVPAKSIWCA